MLLFRTRFGIGISQSVNAWEIERLGVENVLEQIYSCFVPFFLCFSCSLCACVNFIDKESRAEHRVQLAMKTKAKNWHKSNNHNKTPYTLALIRAECLYVCDCVCMCGSGLVFFWGIQLLICRSKSVFRYEQWTADKHRNDKTSDYYGFRTNLLFFCSSFFSFFFFFFSSLYFYFFFVFVKMTHLNPISKRFQWLSDRRQQRLTQNTHIWFLSHINLIFNYLKHTSVLQFTFSMLLFIDWTFIFNFVELLSSTLVSSFSSSSSFEKFLFYSQMRIW